MMISAEDRQLITACQAGLPLVAEPYAALAKDLGTTESDVMARLTALKQSGVIRRIGIAPNHYKLGMSANGMTVWDVEDHAAEELGPLIGAMADVTHCYLRPRARPIWPYNLFAMVHGATRDEVEEKRARIADLLGDACKGADILYSTAILKKTGLRLRKKGG
ncbi:MAG: Lrp/AsnC family transcriptional regulator [Silicimonas sp.]|nr:Lrp/AsnC family transcriptional regulator [Silicimonas sp.]